jgi:hypothetical protein
MNIRVAASALVVLLWAAGLFAQAPGGSELTVTGQLVSTGDMSLVVKADDGREQGPLIVTTTTQLASGLAAGNRVTVFYHPVGDRQVADRVVPAPGPAQPNTPQTRPTVYAPSGARGPIVTTA